MNGDFEVAPKRNIQGKLHCNSQTGSRLIDSVRHQSKIGEVFEFGKLKLLLLSEAAADEFTELFAYLIEAGSIVCKQLPGLLIMID